jgi:pilus assembly protein CpaF
VRLGDKFREAGITTGDEDAPAYVAASQAQPSTMARLKEEAEIVDDRVTGIDPLANLKRRASEGLFARLGDQRYDASLSKKQLHTFVVRELDAVLQEEDIPLDADERHSLVAEVKNDILGYGPIEQFLADDSITEVMVNSDNAIFVERAGTIYRTEARFVSQDHLRQVIERIVTQVGRRIDESSAMVDARLPDGSRVNGIIPPLSIDGPMLTIRKFAKEKLLVEDLIENGSMSRQCAEFLEACVVGKLNILIAGGTGTGKTTMLNILSSFIPERERIVTIEDSAELQLRQEHVIRLETRPANVEGKGAVAIRDLVKNSLRMRPDRIVVGEVRGSETLDMLQAMNTGHEGSLSTVHANSSRDALSRLETMVLMAGMDLPIRAIREQMASAIDLIVHISRLRDGTRRVTGIDEVIGMEGETATLGDLFAFDFDAGFTPDGRFAGDLKPTGIRPMFSDRLEQQGISLSGDVFGDGLAVLGQEGGW